MSHTEHGTGNARTATPHGTCFAEHPKRKDVDLCDRDAYHTGRHAGWADGQKRVYWKKEEQ